MTAPPLATSIVKNSSIRHFLPVPLRHLHRKLHSLAALSSSVQCRVYQTGSRLPPTNYRVYHSWPVEFNCHPNDLRLATMVPSYSARSRQSLESNTVYRHLQICSIKQHIPYNGLHDMTVPLLILKVEALSKCSRHWITYYLTNFDHVSCYLKFFKIKLFNFIIIRKLCQPLIFV